ncbi:MAG: hypothetical protein NZO58_00035 [Gemmataceae bacterium]|nr:hypothetical protein [Gemmataceae bacterium]
MSRSIYTLLIVLAVGTACGRIVCAQLVFEPCQHRNEGDPPGKRLWPKKVPAPMPTFGSNDRSRWATVRALVEQQTYVVGRRNAAVDGAPALAPLGQLDALQAGALLMAGNALRSQRDSGIIFEDGYQSVDKVLRPDKLEFYSSKPPLLATLVAGLYWLFHWFGLTMAAYPGLIVRSILIVVNVVPFAWYLHVLAGWLERWCIEPWARLFVFVTASFATLVSPFLITLNNHLPCTFATLFALHAMIRIWESLRAGQRPAVGWFLLAGFGSGFAVAMELPAAAFAGAVGVALLAWAPARTLVYVVPAGAVPIAAFFATNYLAVGQWRPVQSEFDGAASWYQYDGSHWRKPAPGEVRRGIDWARQHESRAAYAFHVLIGHHGWLSLTPVWWLALVGMATGTLRGRQSSRDPGASLPWFVPPLAMGVSTAVIAFYLLQTDNYGGFTVGLRWLMWLTPLWLACLVPVVERLARSRAGRGLAYVLLGVSLVSANYSLWNPWRHPWLYDLMVACGWPGY